MSSSERNPSRLRTIPERYSLRTTSQIYDWWIWEFLLSFCTWDWRSNDWEFSSSNRLSCNPHLWSDDSCWSFFFILIRIIYHSESLYIPKSYLWSKASTLSILALISASSPFFYSIFVDFTRLSFTDEDSYFISKLSISSDSSSFSGVSFFTGTSISSIASYSI